MKKTYRATIECENGYPCTPQWFRKLEIPESYSLYQVRRLMQGLLEFADDHPCDFYGSLNGWTRSLVLTEHDSYAVLTL